MTRAIEVPFSKPTVVGGELADLESAVAGGHLAGDGPYSSKCSQLLERELAAPKVLLTPSCTHALEMSALLLDIGPGDEVVVPSFAFVSTANAFVMRGATPVFVDVKPDDLNLDASLLAEKITPRTKAIVPLHYGGLACDMKAIRKLAEAKGVPIIEDNAHGLFATDGERGLGTLGALGAVSFHATKTFTCGEGGALLVNDQTLISRAEILREKGTNRRSFARGERDRYTWVDLGSSYLPSELQAAYLYGQLVARTRVLERYGRLWRRYRSALADWARFEGVTMPVEGQSGTKGCRIFYLLLPSRSARDGLIEHLAGRGIRAAFHYLPLHRSRMGRVHGRHSTSGAAIDDCPVAEWASERLARLPLYFNLEDADLDRVIEAVLDFKSDGIA